MNITMSHPGYLAATESGGCESCLLITQMTRENPLVRTRNTAIIHFTRAVIPLILSSADVHFGSTLHKPMNPLPYLLIIVLHRDDASEKFKNDFRLLFTKPDADLNFLFIEGGSLTCRTSSPAWDRERDIPRSFLNLFATDTTCAVCFEAVNVTEDDSFMCRDCGTVVCHPCLTSVILARGIDVIRNDLHSTGYISISCPVCRRLKYVQSERWDVCKRLLVKDGVGVLDRPFRQLVRAMKEQATKQA
jgi:hypothetical protein